MSNFPLGGYKSIRYLGSSPGGTATSGNLALSFNVISVTGRIIGVEFGSPMFDTATGSLYIIASGATWNQNRTIATINGIPQSHSYYPVVAFQRDATQGTLLSGINWSAVEPPFVDGDQIGIAASGAYNGGAALIIIHYV